jgi:Tol biopolymer transport system component
MFSIFILISLTNLNTVFAEQTNSANSEKDAGQLKDSHQLTTFGSQPSWSPNGEQIVFVSDSSYGSTHPHEIWRINANGSNPVLLRKMPENTGASYPKFSPDGKQIAFIGEEMCATCHSRNYLSVMDSEGSNMREIAEGGYRLEFTWTGDNKIILARGDNETSTSFFKIDPKQNSEPTFLTQLPLGVNGWNIVISNDGTILFTGLDYHHNSQLYSLDLADNMKTIHATEGLFLVGMSKDGQTIFATDDSQSNSFTLYAIDTKNAANKTRLSYGYFDYSIHENAGSDIHVAYAYGPGGVVVLSDKEQMDKLGVYVGTHVVPEFPFAVQIFVISLVSLLAFYRIGLSKVSN